MAVIVADSSQITAIALQQMIEARGTVAGEPVASLPLLT